MNTKDILKANLFDIKEVLDSLKVEFWLSLGTLLGAVRDKDFVDGDLDIDVGIWPYFTDDRIWKELVSQKGFELVERRIVNDKAMEYKMRRNGIPADLDFWYVRGDYCYNGKKGISIVLPSRVFEKFALYEFLGKTFLVPHPPENYLESLYWDWKMPVKSSNFREYIKAIKYDWEI